MSVAPGTRIGVYDMTSPIARRQLVRGAETPRAGGIETV